jgi:hypothetical protein
MDLSFSACVIACEERGVKNFGPIRLRSDGAVLAANGKIQKEQEQSEAQPDGA